MTDSEKLTKYFNALTEIAEITENRNMPFCEIFAQNKLHKTLEIACEALGKPTDFTKQPNLKL